MKSVLPFLLACAAFPAGRDMDTLPPFIEKVEEHYRIALRGGYAEDWTVFWITAHFLNAAAQFKELGVAALSKNLSTFP